MVTLNTALAYRKLGWSIIPIHTLVKGRCTCGNEDCATPGKHPRVKWSEFIKRLPDVEEVSEWFGDAFVGSNIGVVTGSISNIIVVDCDGKKGVLLAKKELDLPFPTLIALTGGGGFHIFYKPSGASIESRIGLLPNVDLKAEKGFVVLPPSIHMSGYKYRWFRRVKPAKISADRFPKPEVDLPVNLRGWEDEYIYGVDEGMRASVAAKLAGKYVAMGLGLLSLWYLMREWNRHNRPPLPESELKTTVKFIYRKHYEETDKPEQISSVKQLLHLVKRM